MSYAARLIHDLVLVIPVAGIGDDDYGHPVAGAPEEVAVRGLVQPKDVREIALVSEAGAEIGDHTIFTGILDVPVGAWFVNARGERLDVRGVRRFEYGHSPHLEIDARLVRSGAEVGS